MLVSEKPGLVVIVPTFAAKVYAPVVPLAVKTGAVGCHGTDGRAQTDMGKKVSAADLTSGAVQHQSDSQLATIVKDGKSKMPSFDQKLSDAEVRSVIAYIRRIAKAH